MDLIIVRIIMILTELLFLLYIIIIWSFNLLISNYY